MQRRKLSSHFRSTSGEKTNPQTVLLSDRKVYTTQWEKLSTWLTFILHLQNKKLYSHISWINDIFRSSGLSNNRLRLLNAWEGKSRPTKHLWQVHSKFRLFFSWNLWHALHNFSTFWHAKLKASLIYRIMLADKIEFP